MLAQEIKESLFTCEGDGTVYTDHIEFEKIYGPLPTDCVISEIEKGSEYKFEDLSFNPSNVAFGRTDWGNDLTSYMSQNKFHNFSKSLDLHMAKGFGAIVTDTYKLPHCCQTPYARVLNKENRVAIILKGNLGTNKYYADMKFKGYYMWVYAKNKHGAWALIHRCFHSEG